MVEVEFLENPATAQWGHTLTHSDYNKMVKGFRPQNMDDKWMIVTDTPDAQGNIVVRLCRSWGAKEYFSLTVAPGNPNETEGKDWATVVKISWDEKLMGQTDEEEAKQMVINLCKGFLGCEFKN
jgi:hypothetical protein